MSNEWAYDALREEVPTVNNFGGYTPAYLGVAGACPRGELVAQLVQDGSGLAAARTGMRSDVVVPRPKTHLQKNPFTTQGAVISGATSGPHRAWDPV